MTLLQIINQALRNASTSTAETQVVTDAKSELATQLELLWQYGLWKDSVVGIQQSALAADSGLMILPKFAGTILGVRTSDSLLLPDQPELSFRVNPEIWETEGDPIQFVELPAAVHRFDEAEMVTVSVAASGSDTVNIRWLDSANVEHSDSYEDADTLANCLIIYAVTRETGSDIITLTADGTTVATMAGAETSIQPRLCIQLNPWPSEDTTIRILVKRRCPTWTLDNELCPLHGAENVLMARMEAWVHRAVKGNLVFYESCMKSAASAMEQLLREELTQRNTRRRIEPQGTGPGGDWWDQGASL